MMVTVHGEGVSVAAARALRCVVEVVDAHVRWCLAVKRLATYQQMVILPRHLM